MLTYSGELLLFNCEGGGWGVALLGSDGDRAFRGTGVNCPVGSPVASERLAVRLRRIAEVPLGRMGDQRDWVRLPGNPALGPLGEMQK